ncbi:hypothetical protein N658DRAFT_491264 [Parathielavia hyrcaniae]|uniref:Uncharacterized protein n=1 Tax=Parathielavia hyrcaniae TaxID=113614 RepID=A0AAN6QE88_9PEZI|nr:hypothetical protein N658DRAFT_491264 [Parathielavia hyrcaniae]
MVMQSGFSSLDEKVAMLDDVVSGVWSVAGEPAGRYERVARECGEWVARAEGVLLRQKKRLQQQQQTSPTNDLDQDEAAAAAAAELELIPPLPPAWHEEAAHLARRLDDWRRKLRELGQLPSSSSTTGTPDKADGDGNGGTRPEQPSLARILAGCRALVHGMLAELDTMEQIQRDVAATEMLWVRDMNRHGLGGTDEGAARAGAIWRAL